MTFSVKQLVFFVALCALAIAYIATLIKLRHLESEHRKLLEIAGIPERVSDRDRYSMFACGWHGREDKNKWYGSVLLRVDAHERYKIRLVHYDGQTQKRITKETDLNDPIVAITCLPGSTSTAFLVQSTYMLDSKTSLNYEGGFASDIHTLEPLSRGSYIASDESVLTYYFYPAQEHSSPNLGEQTIIAEDIVKLCDKHRISTVFFQILPR
jgi:hypothetical protein